MKSIPNQQFPPKPATIVDVAREAGVSPKTVSRVINANDYVSESTREKIETAIEKLGYRPNRAARSLASTSNTIIGLVMPNATNAYYAEVVRGVEEYVQDQGYNVLMVNTQGDNERERHALEILEEHRADGVILNTPQLPDEELKSALQRQKASVIIGSDPVGDLAGLINIDVRSAMFQAVEHLVSIGRARIAYAKLPADQVYPQRERLTGFLQACKQYNLPEPEIYTTGDTLQASRDATLTFLSQDRQVDAIICYNDLVAIGAVEACDRLSIHIPEDIAIIGFDDLVYLSLQRISLTTFRIPRYEVGMTAAQMLFARMNGQIDSQEFIFSPEFIQRASTSSTQSR